MSYALLAASVSTIAVLAASVPVSPVRAACSEPPYPIVCSGDVESVDLRVDVAGPSDGIFDVEVKELTRSPTTVELEGKTTGNFDGIGYSGPDLAVEFDGGSFGVESPIGQISAISEGAAASNGANGTLRGGDGQWGGAGGDAQVTILSGFVQGEAAGVRVRSIGFDGGNGGRAKTLGNTQGGKGGKGGDGGPAVLFAPKTTITVTNSSNDTPGVLVESTAGDGGDGGDADSQFAGNSEGGNGGVGGRGRDALAGNLNSKVRLNVSTKGDNSEALLVRSYGGDGGDGGTADSTFGKGKGGAASGTGPGGGVGVYVTGNFSTEGDDSTAILAQSIGGFDSGDDGSASGIKATFGASSESAGGSGIVIVNHYAGEIVTQGDDSYGIAAQSTGGGGGVAGKARGIVALGGTGLAAGDGERVTVNSLGSRIETSGYGSSGILAQSIGGGGGTGSSAHGVVAIGGDAGAGGDGDAVNVTNDADISTTGGHAPGIQLQSIGGGGGRGSIEDTEATGIFAAYAIGASGGDSGSGGNVHYQDTGFEINDGNTVTTRGDSSQGILAESTANGGGNGGGVQSVTAASVGFGLTYGKSGSGGAQNASGNVEVYTASTINTFGDDSEAIKASSYGGGGGSAGVAIAVSGVNAGISAVNAAIGRGGGASTAGDITVVSNSALSTSGDHASGISASSIAGAGGDTSLRFSGNGISLGSVSIANGEGAGEGGDAGTVEVTVSNSITTTGIASYGIKAESQGGDGGSQGATVNASIISGGDVLLTGVRPGDGGAAGQGGSVTVTTTSDARIDTFGDQADAVRAVSSGGGGGDTGLSVTASGVSFGTLGVSVGTGAGSGGRSDKVTVIQNGAIATDGDQAAGIFAHSSGGNGGKGAATINASTFSVASVNVAIGDGGGGGGISGDVDVKNYGEIGTNGTYSDAIHALATGGNGGTGSAVISSSGISQASATVAIGGDGGGGGRSGIVDVTNEADLYVGGDNSHAIYAQSNGGAGGSGGYAIAAGISTSLVYIDASVSLDVAVGGDGGGGGDAGSVTVTNSGDIEADGAQGAGIKAISIGGNGGDGGNSFTGRLDVKTGLAVNIGVAVGGDGGSGGVGDEVRVENYGSINTSQYMTPAIDAQSIGGDGGAGGGAYAVFGLIDFFTIETDWVVSLNTVVGGDGGSGMHAGPVTVVNEGTIETQEGSAQGISAMSTGGGGGKGGLTATLALDIEFLNPTETDAPLEEEKKNVGNVSFEIAVGGDGGAAGDGNTVDVTNRNSITTHGESADGIMASSTGGGGGDGGSNYAKNIYLPSYCEFGIKYKCVDPKDKKKVAEWELDLRVSVGGKGGASGDGGNVTVDSFGEITTFGASSNAINAQSTGGGGGNGGASRTGLKPWINLFDGDADTGNDDAINLDFYKLVTGYTTIEIFVGGSGGAQGDGGDIHITNEGSLTTWGEDSYGISADSTGGGGGTFGRGGESINSFAVLPTKFGVGGLGSGGGDGGNITIENRNSITTHGDRSGGIFAHTVGGGGGDAGNVAGGLDFEFKEINFGPGTGVQRDAGDGGDGGDITIEHYGSITTDGRTAHGIHAISVGGSGGSAGVDGLGEISGSANRTFIGSAGDEGDGGDITIDVVGDIWVNGRGSIGVVVGSVAGSERYDKSGDVSVTVDGSVIASGFEGRAVWIGSAADGLGALCFFDDCVQGEVKLTVNETGSLQTEADGRETISLKGVETGGVATVVNKGSVRATEREDDTENYVLRALDIAPDILNEGLLSGSILVEREETGATTAFLANGETGRLELGEVVDLGPKSSMTNLGTMTAGSLGKVDDTELSVDLLRQAAIGKLWVDLDPKNQTGDYIELVAAGSDATMGGSVVPHIVPLIVPSGTSGEVDILHADDGSIEISDLEVVDTLAVTYELEKTTDGTAETVSLLYAVDYKAPGAELGAGHREFAAYLERLIEARLAELEEGDSDDYAWIEDVSNQILNARSSDVYQGYTPDFYFAPIATGLASNRAFVGQLQSCPAAGADGLADFAHQGECRWFQGGGRATDRDGNSGYAAYSENAYALSGGFQSELREGLFAGLAASYEYATLDGSLSSSGTVNRLQVGGVLKREAGAWTVAGSLTGGIAFNDLNREVITPAGSVYAQGSPQAQFVSLGGLGTYEADFGNFYLKPSLGVGVAYLHQNGFTETGAGIYNYDIGAAGVVQYWANPALEIGTDISRNGHAMRAYVSAGLLATGTSGDDIDASFAIDPGGNGFTISDDPPDLLADLSVGLDAQISGNVTLRLDAGALLGDDYSSYSGSAKIRFGF